jgi:NADPH:quinone reductase-like Zn-dependent oxidoreductase
MTRRLKVVVAALLLITLAIVGFNVAIQYDAPCPQVSQSAQSGEQMTAIIHRCYGAPEVLHLESVTKPVPASDEVLVKVHAAGLNPHDWHYVRGTPYLLRTQSGFGAPSSPRLGVDFAGTVEAVGDSVTRFRPGNAVFGFANGSFAEYVVVKQVAAVGMKPANLTFAQAAATPIAALSALQALRDKGHVRPGSKVLINGASGGVGTFAVQLAKSMGAEVTGVCSERNEQLVRNLGVDHVIDYGKEDFTKGSERYDVIIDNVVNHSLSEYRRVLRENGILVVVGVSDDKWWGPVKLVMQQKFLTPLSSRKFVLFMADFNARDLNVLKEAFEAGQLTPIIDRKYSLADLPEAVRYSESGRARGKIVIEVVRAD